MSKIVYLGNGRQHPNYDLINFSICLSDIPKAAIRKAKNGKKYLSLTIARLKDPPDKYGNSHYVKVDDWQPEQSTEENDGLGF